MAVGRGATSADATGAEKFLLYAKEALKMGALDALILPVDRIVFDHRTILKCMYGCRSWNNSWVCPSAPKALMPWEAQRVLELYSWALLIHTRTKKAGHEVSFAIESKAYVDGYYFAFSLSDCAICEVCAYQRRQPCIDARRARPAMQAMGIDVFATVRAVGLPIETLKDPDQRQRENWYSLVFFE